MHQIENVDVFDILKQAPKDVLIGVTIPTNGNVDKNGSNIMGKGFALLVKKRIPSIDKVIGNFILKYGNRSFVLGKEDNIYWISMPTKHDWRNDSDLTLICKSAQEIVEIADKYGLQKVLMPYPGIGCGNLTKQVVGNMLELILDDRFYLFSYS